MSLRLTLVTASSTAATRHAAFPSDEPLDARGVQWVAEARRGIGRHDMAWTGPSTACRQTAAGLGLVADVDELLREWDQGCWSGQRLDAIADAEPGPFAAWMSDPTATPHGGESLRALLERVRTWLAGLPPTGSAVVIVPVAVVRAAAVAVTSAPAAAFWRHEPAPLTATVLHGTPQRWSIRILGTPLDRFTATSRGAAGRSEPCSGRTDGRAEIKG